MGMIVMWLGSGFAFSIGVGVCAWLMRKTAPNKELADETKKSVVLLEERNTIGLRQFYMLERIAESLERNN